MYIQLPPLLDKLANLLLIPPLVFVLLPISIIYHTLYYLLTGPAFPGWTLKHYLITNIIRIGSTWFFYGRLPQPDPEAKIIPAKAAKYLDECQVECFDIPPIREDVPRVSVLKRKRNVVKPMTVPGFMVKKRLEGGQKVLI